MKDNVRIVQSMVKAIEVATYGERRDKERKQKDKEKMYNKIKKKIGESSSIKKNPVAWWGKECEKAIEDRKKVSNM